MVSSSFLLEKKNNLFEGGDTCVLKRNEKMKRRQTDEKRARISAHNTKKRHQSVTIRRNEYMCFFA